MSTSIDPATPPSEPDPGLVTVRTGESAFRTAVEVRGHELVADEPEAAGGEDAGPTPYDLVCAALGSCTTITVRMYANRKDWPLRSVSARVGHARVPSGEGERARDRFLVELMLEGDLSDAQRARLLEIGGRCPVHRTLAAGSVVEVREAGAE